MTTNSNEESQAKVVWFAYLFAMATAIFADSYAQAVRASAAGMPA